MTSTSRTLSESPHRNVYRSYNNRVMVALANSLSDRACGCILGGAIGNAMGAPYEGLPGRVELDDSGVWAIRDERPVWQIAQKFGASGYVVESVPLALYCAHLIQQKPLGEVLSDVVEAGGDTDTVAAVAGQIVGRGLAVRKSPHGSSKLCLMQRRLFDMRQRSPRYAKSWHSMRPDDLATSLGSSPSGCCWGREIATLFLKIFATERAA